MFIEFMCMFHAINQLMFVAVHEQNMFYLFRQKGSKAWIAFREPGEFQLSNSFYCYKLMCSYLVAWIVLSFILLLVFVIYWLKVISFWCFLWCQIGTHLLGSELNLLSHLRLLNLVFLLSINVMCHSILK